MKKKIITISREFCTGGQAIAQKVAEEMGIPFYDKELITLAARESGLSEEAIAASEKKRTGSLLYSLYTMGADLPLNDQVQIVQSKIIRQEAAKGPCVLVGRCADYVLRERTDVLHVFLHAPLEYRRARGLETGLLPQDVEQSKLDSLLQREDKNRASYYNYYTENRWGHAEHYDLCLDASMGQDLCVKLILLAACGE